MVGPRKLLGDTEKANVHDVHFEKGTSLFLQGARKFRKNKMAVTSCATIVILYIMSICASFIAPYSFDEGELEDQNLPPSWYALFMEEGFKEKLKSWAKAEENFDFMSDQPMVDRPDPSNIWEDQLTAAEPVAILSFFEKGSMAHLMGTDEIGQDIFSRVIFGSAPGTIPGCRAHKLKPPCLDQRRQLRCINQGS